MTPPEAVADALHRTRVTVVALGFALLAPATLTWVWVVTVAAMLLL